MSGVLRYVRLYVNFVRFSFSRALEFRIDFFFRIVMDLTYYLANIAFFGIIFEHTQLLGGWTLPETTVFIAGVFVLDALQMTIFANNTWALPQLVNKGDLDYHLVRPVSPLFMVSFREFAANSFVNLVMACSFLSWALWQIHDAITLARTVVFVGLLFVGVLMFAMMHMLFILPVFWIHQAEGLRQLFWGIEHFFERPHQIFTGLLGRILLSVLPFGLFVSVPTHLLLNGLDGRWLAWIALVFVGMAAALGVLWTAGLRAYSSASS